VNDSYFGKVTADRLKLNQDKGFLVFKADGQARGKIGLSPARAKSVLGSYSSAAQLLTIVRFNKPAGAKSTSTTCGKCRSSRTAAMSATLQRRPRRAGQAFARRLYELESSSPAAALAPGAKLVHTHETYHLLARARHSTPSRKRFWA